MYAIARDIPIPHLTLKAQMPHLALLRADLFTPSSN